MKLTKESERALVASRILSGIPLTAISKDLNIPYVEALKVQSELDMSAVTSELTRETVHRAADNLRAELAESGAGELVSAVDEAVSAVDGLQKLNSRVQEVGLKLADRIAVISTFTEDARDVQLLADALTKIQTAFFKTGPAVNILNQTNNMSESGVSTFSQLLRD